MILNVGVFCNAARDDCSWMLKYVPDLETGSVQAFDALPNHRPVLGRLDHLDRCHSALAAGGVSLDQGRRAKQHSGNPICRITGKESGRRQRGAA